MVILESRDHLLQGSHAEQVKSGSFPSPACGSTTCLDTSSFIVTALDVELVCKPGLRTQLHYAPTMKTGDPSRDKELYKRLRTLTCGQLWGEEVPRFDRAPAAERLANVSLIRAVGVVFSESGTEQQKAAVRPWLHRLLRDPAEKIRRYAMAALPKIGAGASEEMELLAILRTSTIDREKRFLGDALAKIGGRVSLGAISDSEGAADSPLVQKVRANVARTESPSAVRMGRELRDFSEVRIHLRGRAGLEQTVRAEVEESPAGGGRFRVAEVSSGLVVILPTAPFAMRDLYELRCFGTLGFVLGSVDDREGAEGAQALAELIASPLSRRLLETFTEGALRYRLEFVSKGHQRGAVRLATARAFALCPEILNDARSAPWAIEVHPGQMNSSVELRPRLSPDPRLAYRRGDVPAASHPPLAACMARLGAGKDDIVWDPFCGSGLELVERALLGGVRAIYGTDLSESAIAIAEANFAAADLPSVQANFTRCDFRDFPKVGGLKPGTVTLIITNPPMGKRVPIRDLGHLIEDLFSVAAEMLKPGGRLVFANPLRIESPQRSLKLQSRQVVDFGGFDCRLEVYVKGTEKRRTPNSER